MGTTGGGSATAGGALTEQGLNIQNLQSILQGMGFSAQEQVRFSQRVASVMVRWAGRFLVGVERL